MAIFFGFLLVAFESAGFFWGGSSAWEFFFRFSVLVAGIYNTWVFRVNNFFADRRVDFLIWQAKTLVFQREQDCIWVIITVNKVKISSVEG